MRDNPLYVFVAEASVSQPGAKVVSFGAIVAEISGMFFNANFIAYTLFPSLMGAAIHTTLRALSKEAKLTPIDIVTVSAIALFTGIWGGPFTAELMPATQQGIPLFCFIVSLWAKDVTIGLRDLAKRAIDKVLSA